MILNNNKYQNNPPESDIKFILKLFNSNKFIDAKKEIDKQIIKYSNSATLYNILGAILAAQNQLNKAVENYKKAIKIKPHYAQAYNNLGVTLHKLNKINEAIDCYKNALGIKSDFAEAFSNMGNSICELGKPNDALQYFKKAIQIKSDYAEAHFGLGIAYQDLGKKKEALDNFQKAIKIKPDYAEVYNNLGVVLNDLTRFDESLSNYNKGIKLKPNHEKLYNNLGNLLNNLGRYDEATTAFRQAIKIKPDYAKAYSNLLLNLTYKTNFDPELYLSEAKKFRSNCQSIKKNLFFKYQYEKKPKKLRLGLVSADFGNHPGGFFTLSTLRELRKKNFELIAYSAFDRTDEFVHHFRPLFLKWHSIEKKKDDEVVEQIFKDGIHILIELQGHSAENRIPVFMYKAAPIQISWLSQGTLGLTEIDYLIGSPITIPSDEESHFVEKIWRLPEISHCFTPPDFDVKINNLPSIKNNFVTFGNANKLTKMNDDVVSLWSKILLSIPNSKLLLRCRELTSQKIVENTFERFKKYNINKNRLLLLGKAGTRKELLETYNKIDIALDPFPFQGYTSTCEAVWMGVPIITLKGNRYLFHSGESINSNLNMHDWIAKNYDEYISKAIKFSSNINELSKIRMNLRKIILQSPVCDAVRLTEHFSKMLWEIWEIFLNKEKN